MRPAEDTPGDLARDVLVALSLIRRGFDTSVARFFQEQPGRPLDRALLREAVRRAEPRSSARDTRPNELLDEARRARELGRTRGLSAIFWTDEAYPALLRHIPDPPLVLWARGDLSVLSRPAVAVVGSRAATPASITVAATLGRDLARAGLVVVSGLARGVDGAAHGGALEGGGATVAVLGCGADIVYPGEHRALAARVVETGVILSELPPGTLPLPGHFPLRNRIISGLSRAVVVVEASERSGSLITARTALEQGRDVLAVPGGVGSGRYRGSHALIKDGARLVETVEDVLQEVGWGHRTIPSPGDASKSSNMSDLEKTLSPDEPWTLDELARRTGRPAQELLAELGGLELEGRVARAPGGGYVRLDGPAKDR